MKTPTRLALTCACASAALACASVEKSTVADAEPRARAAEAVDAPRHAASPRAVVDGEPPDGAFVSLVQPGDGTISLSVKDGVLPAGDYRVGLTIAEVCIDPIGTAAAAAAGGPEAMIPVLEVGALHVDAGGRTRFLDTGALDAVMGADLSGTAILIVPAEGPRPAPVASTEEEEGPAVVCAVLDESGAPDPRALPLEEEPAEAPADEPETLEL